jgi:carboxyl-terminal processing protease
MTQRSQAGRGGAWLMTALVVALAGCGGGGGGDSGGGDSIGPSSASARRCVAPRPAGSVDGHGRPYNDMAGTATDEKRWVQAWNNETYLWYREVNDRGPQAFGDPVSYFMTLKSNALTANGQPRDRFHFVYDTPAWVALSQSGISHGYGFNIALLSTTPPRQAMVAYTDPGTPAATAGISRGAQVLAVDGVDLVNNGTQAGVNVLNAGLFPSAPGNHTFSILDRGASVPRTVTLNASPIELVPVQNVRTLPAPYQSVGYLLFNDHIATSELQLVNAMRQLRDAGVTDLVLDLRYNGGGYLDISSELAYMIAGPVRTQNKVYESLRFNDKNPFQLTAAQRITPFHATTQGFSTTEGQALPYLNLGRVYVLAGGDTCSASEALVNGLRGAGVQVVLVGSTTCGKPYGFYPTDNCGTTYFTVQFEGVNDIGFGDYADGFTPTCQVNDDFQHGLGDVAEARLSVALGHRATGFCQPAVGRAQPMAARPAPAAGSLVRSALRENRIYRER